MQSVNTSIRLLEEFLENCEVNGASDEDLELCAELASNCDMLRPNLSKLATETDDKDDILGNLLYYFLIDTFEGFLLWASHGQVKSFKSVMNSAKRLNAMNVLRKTLDEFHKLPHDGWTTLLSTF